MKWKKIGQIFEPKGGFPWMQSHAANPFAVPLENGVFKVYFTCRNAENQSHIGWVDIDFANDRKILGISKEPVLSPGDPGLFDDSGVAMGTIQRIGEKDYLYFLGWNLKVTVPWQNSIGLAVGDAKTGKFEKVGRAPIMDRSNEDPFSISYPCVVSIEGGFVMFYGSNLKWGKVQDEMDHVIKRAFSTDGINWQRDGKTVIDLEHPGEYALSKPYVIKMDGVWRMFYSYRANGDIQTYRIGMAESSDLEIWTRKDEEIGIDVSAYGWDSEMIEYPQVFDYNGKFYMLYNGNSYGRTGFGLAVLEDKG